MRTTILVLIVALFVRPTASSQPNRNWRAEFTPEACESGDVYRKRGMDPDMSREDQLAEERKEAQVIGAIAIPPNFPGLFLQDSRRTYYAKPEAMKKLLMAALRASKRGYGLLLTSAFRSERGAIAVACEYTDAAGDPDKPDRGHGRAEGFDVFLTDLSGRPHWSRNGRPLMEAQKSAPGWYVTILADIMYGDRSDHVSLYRLVSEIWHFETVEGSCTNNICLVHPGASGCTCNAEGA